MAFNIRLAAYKRYKNSQNLNLRSMVRDKRQKCQDACYIHSSTVTSEQQQPTVYCDYIGLQPREKTLVTSGFPESNESPTWLLRKTDIETYFASHDRAVFL